MKTMYDIRTLIKDYLNHEFDIDYLLEVFELGVCSCGGIVLAEDLHWNQD